jgi:hypothetical protein
MEVTPPVHNPGMWRKGRRSRGRGLCHDHAVHQNILILASPGKASAKNLDSYAGRSGELGSQPGGLELRG